MTKKICLLQLISQEPYIIWLSFMVHLCKMMIPQESFFHFFKILILWVVRVGEGGEKGQKRVQNEKNFCLLHSISQESYIIWSSFVAHKCKIIIFSGNFFIFSKFWSFGLLGGLKGNKWPKITKNFVLCIYISGTIHHRILIYGAHV